MNSETDGKKSSFNFTTQKILLIAGLCALFIGTVLLVIIPLGVKSVKLYAVRPLVVMLLSVLLLYKGITQTNRTGFLFLGLFSCLCGIIFLLSDSTLIPYTLSQLWPIMVVSCGVSLFTAYFIKNHHLKAAFLVPSATLVLLGIIFFLFSIDIITVPFRTFAARWWPVLVILTGAGLISLFFHNQRKMRLGEKAVFDDDDEALS